MKGKPSLSGLRVYGKKRMKRYSYRNINLWTLKS